MRKGRNFPAALLGGQSCGRYPAAAS